MKKALALLLILALAFSVCACGDKDKQGEDDPITDPTLDPDYDPTDYVVDEDGNLVNINDPTYIAPDDDNYVSKEDREKEKKEQLSLKEVEKVPYVEEETALDEKEQRALNGWGPEDIASAKMPKSYVCETLDLNTLEMKETTGTYAAGDKLVPELKKIDFQYTLDSKMTSDGMNYLLTMAVLNDEVIRFQYSINLNKATVKEVQVSTDTYTKVYKLKY